MGKILRIKQVMEAVGLSRSTIYERMAKGTFPQPIALGTNSVGWEEEAIAEWKAKRPRGVGKGALA